MSDKLFDEQEFEVVYLKAVIDSLDSMLSSELLELRGSDQIRRYTFIKRHIKNIFIYY